MNPEPQSLNNRNFPSRNPVVSHTIREALERLIVEAGQVVELRILNTPKGTVSGYFDDLDKLAEAANHWSGKAPAVYITPNPVLPELLARANNRVRPYAKATTTDGEILRRVWLLIDFDAKRPADISASNDEHEAAIQRAHDCRDWLYSQGWPAPIYADSGNGAHLMYRIELPNDEPARTLVGRCLKALAQRFDDDDVVVDQAVHNAARIWKLYGTKACKGDDMLERPHRVAWIVEMPEALEIVSTEQMQALAAEFTEATPHRQPHPGHRGGNGSADRYAQAALASEVARVRQAGIGDRNNALNKAAFALGQLISGALDRGLVEDELLAAAETIGLGRSEASKTIASGIDDGMREPREIPEPKAPRRSGKGNGADQQPTARADPARPEIRWIGGELPAAVDQGEQALIAGSGERIYQRGGLLVRAMRQGAIDVKGYRKAAGALAVIPVEAPYLVRRFTETATWTKWNERGREWKPINCPDLVAKTYLSMVGDWKVSALTAIIEAPTLRPDGSILDTPGLDPATGLLFDPGTISFEKIPQNPTREDALEALKVLTEVLKGFPFAAKWDRAVALSAILTGLVRRSIKSAPLHGFSAPKMGSGKSLLGDVAALIATGRPAAVMSHTSDPAEERKRVLALLMEGDPIVCIDNIETPISSETLCSVLTQPFYKDRLLGSNRTITVPTCSTWFATGNNLQVAGDLSTRVVMCTLDPACERPEERAFDVNLYEYIPARRPALVRAGLTILRAYHVAERPKSVANTFGRFEEWSDLVRSAIVWLDMDDPCKSRKGLEAADPVRKQLRAVMSVWWNIIGKDQVTAREVIDRARDHQALGDALLDVAGTRGEINSRRLGNWLGKYARRIEGGLRMIKVEDRQGVAVWQLEKVDPSEPAPPRGFRGFRGSSLDPHGNLAGASNAKNIKERETNPRNPPNPPFPNQQGGYNPPFVDPNQVARDEEGD